MKTYEITIRATLTKTYTVEAEDAATAECVAHEIFDIHNEPDVPENYEQETMDVELTGERE